MFDSIARGYQDGGNWMHAITAVMLFGIAIAVERFYFLYFKFKVDGRKFFTEMRVLLNKGDMAGAKAMCFEAPLPRILSAALDAAPNGERAAQIAVDEEALAVIPQIEVRLHYLSMVANVATLLGLLGTIAGLIDAFAAVTVADPSQKGALLAQGISMAMYTTYYGLVVAIPIMIVYSFLQARASKMVGEIDEYSVKLINLLAERSRGK